MRVHVALRTEKCSEVVFLPDPAVTLVYSTQITRVKPVWVHLALFWYQTLNFIFHANCKKRVFALEKEKCSKVAFCAPPAFIVVYARQGTSVTPFWVGLRPFWHQTFSAIFHETLRFHFFERREICQFRNWSNTDFWCQRLILEKSEFSLFKIHQKWGFTKNEVFQFSSSSILKFTKNEASFYCVTTVSREIDVLKCKTAWSKLIFSCVFTQRSGPINFPIQNVSYGRFMSPRC